VIRFGIEEKKPLSIKIRDWLCKKTHLEHLTRNSPTFT
jgi:hypothetical protein